MNCHESEGIMTQDEIDIMWQQAMRESIKNNEMYTRYHFAKLVAAAEREACAKVVEDSLWFTRLVVAKAIRARGQA
jgi:hypothetical protein